MSGEESSKSAGDEDTPPEPRDDGVLVREPDDSTAGVWVGYFDDDPDSDTLAVQNVWGPKRRTQATIPKAAVEDVVAALEERT